MIEVCSASMQKSLQGLDNTTAEGTEAFDQLFSMLEALADQGINVTATQKFLKDAKRYLKNDFKTHIGRGEHCSDHCTVHALSDSSAWEFRGECDHEHCYECERCESLEGVLKQVAEMQDKADMTEEESVRWRFEYTENVRNIQARKAHLLRSSNQEEAKQHILEKLDDNSCLVIMDWAMKFLPVQYREHMSDFFGKRGRSWHISAVITRATVESKHEDECFVHIFNNCTQNSFAVLSIIEDLLQKVKLEYPGVTTAYLRSDNAGCYHNGPLLLSLREIGVRTGVRPVRYDFFLMKKFEEGTRTGNKADPVRVAREMKTLRNEDGELTFKPEEWRTAQQISSLFSRQTAALRHRGIDAEEISEEDIEAAESEIAFDTLRSLVMDDMGKPSHPIIVGISNICELVKNKKLDSLKLAALKEICNQLHLTTSGPLSRKKTFFEAIQKFSESCTYFQK